VSGTVEEISSDCFSCNKSVREMIFENGSLLRRIEEYGFLETILREIQIPSRVEYIGEMCFYGCKTLVNVTFECVSRLTHIESWVFTGTGLRKIRIPSSVEFIGQGCFLSCWALEEIIFEGHVESIGYLAFDSRVKRVEIPPGIELNYPFSENCHISSSEIH
jgi:hypothetical protein